MVHADFKVIYCRCPVLLCGILQNSWLLFLKKQTNLTVKTIHTCNLKSTKHFWFTLRLVDFPESEILRKLLVFFWLFFLKDKSTSCWMMMDAGNIRILTSAAKKLTTQKHGGRQKLFKANWRETSSRKKEKRRETSLCAPCSVFGKAESVHVVCRRWIMSVGGRFGLWCADVFSKRCSAIAM